MTIEVSVLLGAVSVSIALYFGIANNRRGQKKDDKEEASQSAMIIEKLNGIEKGVGDIKEELKSVKTEVKDDHDRIIRLEESAKQAHKRIDGWEQRSRIGEPIE